MGKYWTDLGQSVRIPKVESLSRTFINPYYHVGPITPDYKAVDY